MTTHTTVQSSPTRRISRLTALYGSFTNTPTLKNPMEKRVFFRGESGLSETLNDRADEFQVILDRFGREKNTELLNPGYLLLFYYPHLLIDWLIDWFFVITFRNRLLASSALTTTFSRLTADTQYSPAHFIRATQTHTHTRKEGRREGNGPRKQRPRRLTWPVRKIDNILHPLHSGMEWIGQRGMARGGGVFK